MYVIGVQQPIGTLAESADEIGSGESKMATT